MFMHNRNFLSDNSFMPSLWPNLPPSKLLSFMELWMAEIALSDQQNIPGICKAIENLFPFHLSCSQVFQPFWDIGSLSSNVRSSLESLNPVNSKRFPLSQPYSFWWDISLGNGSSSPTSGTSVKVLAVLGRPGPEVELTPRLWSDLSAGWALWQATVPTVIVRYALNISNLGMFYPNPGYLTLLCS